MRTPLLSLSLGLWSCAAAAAEPPQTAASVDAACPWGRVGDGKGRLVRCLTQAEAERLLVEPPPPLPGTATAPSAAPVGPAGPKPPALSGVTPVEPAPAAPETPAPVPAPPTASEEELVAEIGSVTADQGVLPEAAKSLKKANARFQECVQKNGGLSAERGEVEVRFMVQGRGRAEGVSVKKRRGMSELAAKCIADIVDRRYVGTPEEPMVGATLQVVISKKKR